MYSIIVLNANCQCFNAKGSVFCFQGSCVMRYSTAGQLWNIIAPREFIDFSYTTDFQDGLLSCGGFVYKRINHINTSFIYQSNL